MKGIPDVFHATESRERRAPASLKDVKPVLIRTGGGVR